MRTGKTDLSARKSKSQSVRRSSARARIELVRVSEDAPEEIRELMKKVHLFQCGKVELTNKERDKWWNFMPPKNSRSITS